MNLLALTFKQMRQRMLSTTLTILSVMLGVGLALAVHIVDREAHTAFAQTDYGYDLVVGPKADPTQLVLNTVYHMGTSPGNVPYALYEDMASAKAESAFTSDGVKRENPFRAQAAWAVPVAVGDSYEGFRIVATTPAMFGVDDAGKPLPAEKTPEYRVGRRYEMTAGRPFAPAKFEAVIGSDVARRTGLTIGSEFHATHGMPATGDVADVHEESWKVVGVLAPTHTAADRLLFIPLPTFYAIFEHEEGLEAIQKVKDKAEGKSPATREEPKKEEKAYTVSPDGTVTPTLPKEEWQVSAVLVKAKSPSALLTMQFTLRNRPEAMGVTPAKVMNDFFSTFFANIMLVILLISVLVVVVAAVSILVGIYNAIAARSREIAILRALGATRGRIVAIVCAEAAMIGLIGGVCGVLAGHALAWAGSSYLAREMGQGITWWRVGGIELAGVGVVTLLAAAAGLVPALKAYRVSVAENLAG